MTRQLPPAVEIQVSGARASAPGFQALPPGFRPALLKLTLLAVLSLAVGCSGKNGRTAAVQNDEGEPAAAKGPIVSLLKMNDPAAKDQLVRGVYALESGAWRWTA